MASNHTKTRRPETQFDLAGVGLQRDGPDQKERNTPETSTLDFALNHLGKSSNATSSQPHASEQPAASSDRRSPWKSYKKLFALQFGNSLHYTVAEKTTITSGMTCVVLMKKIEGSKDDHSMRLIETIKHDRFVPVVEVFPAKKACFVAFEFFPISLAEFTGNPLMNELILASILSQIIGGLAYLEEQSLCHGHLNCSNILVDPTGNVKLWGQEQCQASSNMKANIKALGVITMELIQGYVKEEGRIGLDRPQGWSLGMDFLVATESTSKVTVLKKVKLERMAT